MDTFHALFGYCYEPNNGLGHYSPYSKFFGLISSPNTVNILLIRNQIKLLYDQRWPTVIYPRIYCMQAILEIRLKLAKKLVSTLKVLCSIVF
jgi:hypothetical protein